MSSRFRSHPPYCIALVPIFYARRPRTAPGPTPAREGGRPEPEEAEGRPLLLPDGLLRGRYIELVHLAGLVALDGNGELPVAGQARGGGDELADNDVLLEAGQAVLLALDGPVGEDAGGLLEGGRGEEAVRGERGLRDAEQDRVEGGWLALLLLDPGVLGEHRELVGHLLGEELRVARVVDDDLAQHLADYHLDVFVVDVHALGPVDLLDLAHQVTLGGRGAAVVSEVVLQDRVRVDGAVRDRGVRPDLGALDELRLQEPPLDLVLPHLRVVRRGDGHVDHAVGVALFEANRAVYLRKRRLGLRVPRLEELDD